MVILECRFKRQARFRLRHPQSRLAPSPTTHKTQKLRNSFEADSRLLKMASKLGVSPKIMADI